MTITYEGSLLLPSIILPTTICKAKVPTIIIAYNPHFLFHMDGSPASRKANTFKAVDNMEDTGVDITHRPTTN
ncbi:hypothetical protein Pmani_005250 [Petrolisthes manimaculis]|uniref:Uncharacterized protein n=1 Tax=Petrolisthes manimaculis TaxID=1843537 RepID=A0AAE1QC19_9EUCA|nr:hypothetical protein Pmani_005250 [Petrolisthes manimaculis]